MLYRTVLDSQLEIDDQHQCAQHAVPQGALVNYDTVFNIREKAMIILPGHSKGVLCGGPFNTRHSERGAALAMALLLMILMSAVALGVLAVVQGDGKDCRQRSQTDGGVLRLGCGDGDNDQ